MVGRGNEIEDYGIDYNFLVRVKDLMECESLQIIAVVTEIMEYVYCR